MVTLAATARPDSTMADKQSSVDDDYQDMSDNPQHLRVIFDKTTPNVRNLNRKDSIEEQLLPFPVDRSRSVTLYFSDQYGGSVGFHPKVVSLADEDVINDISKWMSNFMHEIIGMDRLLLVQNRSQFDEAKGNIEKLKDVLKELEDIPPSLVNLLPETNNEEIRDLVLEDLLSLSQVCIDISGRLKRMSSQYELALKRLAEKRHTRMNDAILQGMEDIPAELLVQTVHPSQPPDSVTMDLTQITDEQYSFDSTLSIPVTSSDTSTIEQTRLTELSLTTIAEERTLSEEEKKQLLLHVGEIVGHNDIDHKELTDPEAALKLLTEKVGTVYDLHDPDLLHKLQSLCRSKRFLQKIVSNPNARPPLQINTTTIECDPPVKQALSTPTSSQVGRSRKPSGNSEPSTIYTITEPITTNEPITITGPIEFTAPPASSEPMSPASTISNPPSKCNESSPTRPTNVITTVCTSMYDTPVFSTPVLTTPKEFYTIFHTANSSTPHYAPLRTANDDTPILPTSSASSKRNLTQEINQTDPSAIPPHLGPNLTSTTSQDDLDRHQRDSICPSVRPKATLQKGPDDPHPHTSTQTQVPLTATGSPLPGTKPNNQNKSSQLLNKETDHIPTPYNLDELFMISNEAEMKQCIGDHIYPYVLKKLPPGIARKITGMIINLPKEQLATGIHSQQTLDRMIKEARETLSETYGDTYEQSIPDNDTYSAMFHEVMSSPAKKQRTQGENAPARSHNDYYNSAVGGIPNLCPTTHTERTQPRGVIFNPVVTEIYPPNTFNPYPPLGQDTSTLLNQVHGTKQPTDHTRQAYIGNGPILQAKWPSQQFTRMPDLTQYHHSHNVNPHHPLHPMIAGVPHGRFPGPSTFNRFPHALNHTATLQTGLPEQPVPHTSPHVSVNSCLGPNQTTTHQNHTHFQAPNMNIGHRFSHSPLINPGLIGHGFHFSPMTSIGQHQPQAAHHNTINPSINLGHSTPQNSPKSGNSNRYYGTPSNQIPNNWNANPDTNPFDTINPDPRFAGIEVIFRERRELHTASFLVQRIVSQLTLAPTMNTEELTDCLQNMNNYSRSLEKLEGKVSQFLKSLVTHRTILDQYNPYLYPSMKREVEEAENLSALLQAKLNQADVIIGNEKITISHSKTSNKDLSYKIFSNGMGANDCHVYEFLQTLENNFKILRISCDQRKATILKENLRGTARLSVEDITNYKQAVNLLVEKFGNPIAILTNINRLHQATGMIPTTFTSRPPWQRIEDTTRSHMILIRKAEALSGGTGQHDKSCSYLFSDNFRNDMLLKLLSHEWNEDLKNLQSTLHPAELYKLIIDRYETVLRSASRNVSHTDTRQRKDPEPSRGRELKDIPEMDQYALTYGEQRARDITIGDCLPQDCHFCATFQRLGMGKDYYSQHILIGPLRRNYVNNCPNYQRLSIADKNDFIRQNKFCQFCLRPQASCKNQACGDDHLIRNKYGKKKGYVCLEPSCKFRIELCQAHKEMNMETIEARKKNVVDRFNIDLSIGAFREIPHTWTVHNQTELTPSLKQCTQIDTLTTVQTQVERQARSEDIKNSYTTFKKSQEPNANSHDKSMLFIPQDTTDVRTNSKHTKEVSHLDQPLLVDNTEQLLRNGTKLLANDCKSIFIYSKIQGLTRPLSTLFDSGGGSSLVLSNVPGRQLPACKGRTGPTYLQGIGSGRVKGEHYTMQLPLMDGNKVAVDVYAVPQILQPMSKVDLEPALTYFKEKANNDHEMSDRTKEEIAKASIYRFVQGSLDLLLGVKLLGVFPQLVHTLSCGLSLFKMRLKPSSNALYCLGGPYQSLSSLQSIFPDGALMLQQIDSYLSDWRESAHDITHNHMILSNPNEIVYELSHPDDDLLQVAHDEIIMSVTDSDDEGDYNNCDCDRPLLHEGKLVICCNKRTRLMNKLQARLLGNVTQNMDKPYSRTDWLEDLSQTLINYQHHISTCPVKEPKEILAKFDKHYTPCSMRKSLGELYARYSPEFGLTNSLDFLKSAILHLDTCRAIRDEKTERFNTFVSLKCDDTFIKEFKTFLKFFLTYYPELENTIINPETAHITVLAFTLPDKESLHKAGLALRLAWNKWLHLHPIIPEIGFMSLGFQGVGTFEDRILYLKPSYNIEALKSLHSLIFKEFEGFGFKSDTEFTPHVTFAKQGKDSTTKFPKGIVDCFEDIDIGNTKLYNLEMRSMHKNKDDCYDHYLALPFYPDATLPSNLNDMLREGFLKEASTNTVTPPVSSHKVSSQPGETPCVKRNQDEELHDAWNNWVDAQVKNSSNQTNMKYLGDRTNETPFGSHITPQSINPQESIEVSNTHADYPKDNHTGMITMDQQTNEEKGISTQPIDTLNYKEWKSDTDTEFTLKTNSLVDRINKLLAKMDAMHDVYKDFLMEDIENLNQSLKTDTETPAETNTTIHRESQTDDHLLMVTEDNPEQETTITNPEKTRKGKHCKTNQTKPPKEFMDLASHIENVLMPKNVPVKCKRCSNCPECKALSLRLNNDADSAKHEEEQIINDLINYDPSKGRFCVPLPFKRDPESNLAPNMLQSKRFYKKIVKELSNRPKDKSEVIKSFNKQIELGFIQKLSDLNPELQESILSKTLYVIPWNVVWKSTSVTTPVRIVLNASSKTSSGFSLNDLLCKGHPRINLLPLALVLRTDPILLTLDIQKFYNSCLIPESDYHYQCVWWHDTLDENAEPELYIIKTHIYGVISSGRVLEMCLERVADMNIDNEAFHKLFSEKLYVDDGFGNCLTPADAEKLKDDCERILPEKGFKVKGYAQSYKTPPLEISSEIDGELTVGTIGLIWIPERDVIRLRPPRLDFTGTEHRGRMISGEEFTGKTYQELEAFVPKNLTLKSVTSIVGRFWDPIGIAQGWYLGLKHILRISIKALGSNYEDHLPSEIRDIWVTKIWEMIQLSKIDFPRCTFPLGETYSELAVVGLSDFGKIGRLQTFYSLKKISDENYAVQLLYSTSQVSDRRTVACQEMQSLDTSSELLSKICSALGKVDRKALLMDSTICAYWLMKDVDKLGSFQRLRAHNILSRCSRDEIFHIRSSWNSADVGTKRPEPISCILPDSLFASGPKILKLGLDGCEKRSFIKRISNVCLDPAVRGPAVDGLATRDIIPFSKGKPAITGSPGTTPKESTEVVKELQTIPSQQVPPNQVILAHNNLFVNKVQERFQYHEYLVNPLRKGWGPAVRTLSIVIHFIRKILLSGLKSSRFSDETRMKQMYARLFVTENEPLISDCFTNLCFQVSTDDDTHYDGDMAAFIATPPKTGSQVKPRKSDISWSQMFSSIKDMKIAKEGAIMHFLTLASKELRQFYSKSMLKRHAFPIDGIYYSKQRVLEHDNMMDLIGDSHTTQELGIKNRLPCSDKNSPVAIAIMMFHHRVVANHQGVDRSWLSTLSSIYVFQGQPAMKEIVRSCFHCRYKLKERFKTSYGPINRYSLTFTAVNAHVMLDLSGPYLVRATPQGRRTRNNKNQLKVYLLHTVCLTSFLNTIVIVEDYGSQAFTAALHKIGAVYGYPSVAYTDASRAQLKSLLGTELTMISLLGEIYKETGIEIRVSGSGPSSHSRQGRVEKAIHCFQMFIQNRKAYAEDLTVLQFDSLISQAAAFLNSMPLCHKKRIGSTVSSSLVSPFSFLIGRRSNTRAPAGLPQLARSRGDILDKIALASTGMCNYFKASIPDLLLKPTKHEESKTMIKGGDLVLFPFDESAISIRYKLGLVTELEYDSDQKPRIAEVAYANSSEISLPVDHKDKVKLKSCCRFTRKGVHTLCKIYSADDPNINKDIDLINERLKNYGNTTDCDMTEDDAEDSSMTTLQQKEEFDPLTPDVGHALIASQIPYLLGNQ